MQKPNLILSLVLFALVFIGCSKEDEAKKETITEIKTVRVVDTFYIDYTTKMTYTVTVLSGNNISVGSGKSSAVVEGASVTTVQGGVKVTQVTDATGMVTFNGLYKGAVTVVISKDDYTGVSYIATVNNLIKKDSTTRNQETQIYVSNQIPLFKVKNDPAVGRLTGRVTYQSDLTNQTREVVPEGTVITATIDVSDPVFFAKYLKPNYGSAINDSIYVGKIIQIAYDAAFYDSTDAQGNYDLVLPAAIAGLPMRIKASDLLTQQKVFENTGVEGFNRTKTYRTLFSPGSAPTPVPAAGGAEV
jgi:hypothetical protein